MVIIIFLNSVKNLTVRWTNVINSNLIWSGSNLGYISVYIFPSIKPHTHLKEYARNRNKKIEIAGILRGQLWF